jgi:NAD(P)-dependent dehydrogenase (short-subunit alcohol dehydrogenase family)
MTASFTRPLALVTGASRGIGRAIARALASDHDLLVCARSLAALEQTCAEVTCAGAKVWALAGELADGAGQGRLLAEVESIADGQGRVVEVLVNNAGLAHSAPICKTSDERWATLVAVNLTAPLVLTRGLLPGMRARGRGRIINIASTAALKGYGYTAAYSATKAGLVGMTRALAVELARKRVTVNAVCPGFTDTDIVADAVANITATTTRSDSEARDTLARFSPQGRLRTPDEVAALVVFLASEAAAGITGQALAIDGGETA